MIRFILFAIACVALSRLLGFEVTVLCLLAQILFRLIDNDKE